MAILGSLIFLAIAPGFVAGLVPWWISHWRFEAPFFGMIWVRFAGGGLIALGSIGLLDSFGRFALQGLGTPAPVFPTRHLVVTGLYRYVRNPMYVAVVSAILGQGLLFGNVWPGIRNLPRRGSTVDSTSHGLGRRAPIAVELLACCNRRCCDSHCCSR